MRRIEGLADSVEGITAADPFDLAAGTSAVLATAAPASGAGTWDVTLDVSADLPDVSAGVVIARVQFDAV